MRAVTVGAGASSLLVRLVHDNVISIAVRGGKVLEQPEQPRLAAWGSPTEDGYLECSDDPRPTLVQD